MKPLRKRMAVILLALICAVTTISGVSLNALAESADILEEENVGFLELKFYPSMGKPAPGGADLTREGIDYSFRSYIDHVGGVITNECKEGSCYGVVKNGNSALFISSL